ncbi:Protein FAM188A [Trichoplax sp. H2]|nr:Protein FAM188A [Trichoplax sp. H2]|eukprot:RDD42599.1 Protein FAM188A [Trichoplax sp. H2]
MANQPENGLSLSSIHNSFPIEVLPAVIEIVWGKQIQPSIFRRWCQGFTFSQHEPSALIQHHGGPCAIITAVQANILLELLFREKTSGDISWNHLNDEEVNQLLAGAIFHIIKSLQVDRYIIVALPKNSTDNESNTNQEIINVEDFHLKLRQWIFNDTESLKTWIRNELQIFQGQFGVLSLLYSVILSKGLESIQNDREETAEPLIDPTFGYGSQSLINLMITGSAVANIWDNTRNIDGLVLFGIQKQPQIGFLSLMEHLRYCEVGSFLKNPANPIWILSSAEHLTVLFSTDRSLACTEDPRSEAIRTFLKYDETENGFIPNEKLGNVMEELGLETDIEYVSYMAKCLDQDSLGIILLKNFLNEFFPSVESDSEFTKNFTLYHYNGLQKSNRDGKVTYNECIATTSGDDCNLPNSNEEQFVQCLKTKWRNLLKLDPSNGYPSLN